MQKRGYNAHSPLIKYVPCSHVIVEALFEGGGVYGVDGVLGTFDKFTDVFGLFEKLLIV